MADILFDWFGFDQTGKIVVHSTLAMQLNPKKITRRSDVQGYFPLSKSSLVKPIEITTKPRDVLKSMANI